ncbi:TPA: ANR family transcriptional regulator [Mannheimia haemolytica]|uniref:ANR family transcriptional regulator n=1 Tax=Mannheimia haemolytica TaxID=75985 RepID=A0A378NB64_MANHA|nr:ANR family transcriptional regulator [Mannheimia haemolytica]AGQ39526.1 hypothetical protein J450_10530 [Mannheimia haemolytica D171]EEY10249.1 hypothetical protein COI_1095 [Mannheimia haemolytica serotype A2 str. OVINE]KYL17264.1 hypothetical protein AC571_06425 [Mannheimia haemolytica]KYL22315.1 hypothetical protein AC574_08210 [Mannheimia haemolytica]MDW0535599.1 ANR family transcriptional regulator [Mannheimia haemolytica]
MKTEQKATKFDRFRYYAEKAAEAERKGNYIEAQDHWEVAKLSAKSTANLGWAEQRAEFCKRMHNKPFEGE